MKLSQKKFIENELDKKYRLFKTEKVLEKLALQFKDAIDVFKGEKQVKVSLEVIKDLKETKRIIDKYLKESTSKDKVWRNRQVEKSKAISEAIVLLKSNKGLKGTAKKTATKKNKCAVELGKKGGKTAVARKVGVHSSTYKKKAVKKKPTTRKKVVKK